MRIKCKRNLLALYCTTLIIFSNNVSASVSDTLPTPAEKQLMFQDAEIGVVFHYDLHVFDGQKYNQAINRVTPVADYNIFFPTDLNTDQWVRAAKAAGAKFAIIAATHETGFALYPSDVNPYCTRAIKWKDGKGDIIRDFVNSCRKFDVKPGIYLGIRWNSFMGVHDFEVDGEGRMQKNRQAYYNRMCEGMVKELCTRYGPLFMFWFDGGASDPELGAPDVLPIVKKYQPDCIFYHNAQQAEVRWGGSETGTVGDPCWSSFPFPSIDVVKYPRIAANNNALLKHGDPEGKYYIPAFADIPLRAYNGRHEWFWEPGDESHILPLSVLVNKYYQSVGRNATLILGLTPDTSGRLPETDVARLKDFGDTIRQIFNDANLAGSSQGNKLEIHLNTKQEITRIVLSEDISKGERVRQYRVEARHGKKWSMIARGSVIGHKRIQLFKPVKTKAVRLVIEKSVGLPLINYFKVYE